MASVAVRPIEALLEETGKEKKKNHVKILEECV